MKWIKELKKDWKQHCIEMDAKRPRKFEIPGTYEYDMFRGVIFFGGGAGYALLMEHYIIPLIKLYAP